MAAVTQAEGCSLPKPRSSAGSRALIYRREWGEMESQWERSTFISAKAFVRSQVKPEICI